MGPKYLGTLEVDQRQRLIHATDKLREMLGVSWLGPQAPNQRERPLRDLMGPSG